MKKRYYSIALQPTSTQLVEISYDKMIEQFKKVASELTEEDLVEFIANNLKNIKK